MKDIKVSEIIKNIFIRTFGYLLTFGWIVLLVLNPLLEENNTYFYVTITIIIISFIFISLIEEIKDIKGIFDRKNIEVVAEKEKLKKLYEEDKNKLNIEYNSLINSLNENRKDNNERLEKERIFLEEQYNVKLSKLNDDKIKFQKIVEDEKIYKPYLAKMLADYHRDIDSLKEEMLRTKSNPAIKAADELKQIKTKNHKLKERLKIVENQLIVYETLFPWLEEFKEYSEKEINEIVNKNISEDYDLVKEFLSPDEYSKLPDSQKYQLWLNRYRNKKNKKNWEIGIDFERYVGYKYEVDGYKIVYNGAREGLEDMGRDLIVSKDNTILIIQCKNWNKEKIIHEKHIFQLFGTMILKSIECPNFDIKGVFICTNKLSPTALDVAKKLNIDVLENFEYDKNYPCIKCNISKKDGSKIYHLPFDQQYDKIDIDYDKGECYVATVEEAEKLGFRKAMKHNFYNE